MWKWKPTSVLSGSTAGKRVNSRGEATEVLSVARGAQTSNCLHSFNKEPSVMFLQKNSHNLEVHRKLPAVCSHVLQSDWLRATETAMCAAVSSTLSVSSHEVHLYVKPGLYKQTWQIVPTDPHDLPMKRQTANGFYIKCKYILTLQVSGKDKIKLVYCLSLET